MIKKFLEEIKLIWNKIESSDSIVICTHIDPDGDTIGSAFALKNLIIDNLPTKKVYISSAELPRYLSFLGKVDHVDDLVFDKSLIIVVDTSNKRRVYDKRVITENAIKIDHHEYEENWLIGIGGDYWPATGEVLFEMASILKLKMSEEFMNAIFVAIWTDTDGLSLRTPSKRTLEISNICSKNKDSIIKKLSPNDEEQWFIDNVFKQVVNLNNVSYVLIQEIVPNNIHRNLVSFILANIKRKSLVVVGMNDKQFYRMSIRTKTSYDLSTFCKANGGGGHKQSGGVTKKTYSEVMELIESLNSELEKTQHE